MRSYVQKPNMKHAKVRYHSCIHCEKQPQPHLLALCSIWFMVGNNIIVISLVRLMKTILL